jgi:hypothetical protein
MVPTTSPSGFGQPYEGEVENLHSMYITAPSRLDIIKELHNLQRGGLSALQGAAKM